MQLFLFQNFPKFSHISLMLGFIGRLHLSIGLRHDHPKKRQLSAQNSRHYGSQKDQMHIVLPPQVDVFT